MSAAITHIPPGINVPAGLVENAGDRGGSKWIHGAKKNLTDLGGELPIEPLTLIVHKNVKSVDLCLENTPYQDLYGEYVLHFLV